MSYTKKAADSMLSVLILTATCLAMPERAAADSEPFIGEIAATGNGYCPRGWTPAAGQLLAIADYQALFALFGTIYGGDGRATFGLPDLRGRLPIGVGSGPGLSTRYWGQKGGAEAVTLTVNQLAPHNHLVNANNQDGNLPGPTGNLLAAAPTGGTGNETIYSDQPANKTMAASMISPTGRNLLVGTQDPTLVVRYCVALTGVFPSHN